MKKDFGLIKGSIWYEGTTINGTEQEIIFPASGIELALEHDKYLNAEEGTVYTCTKGGTPDVAEWSYLGTLKGLDGADGEKGESGKVVTTTEADYPDLEKFDGTIFDVTDGAEEVELTLAEVNEKTKFQLVASEDAYEAIPLEERMSGQAYAVEVPDEDVLTLEEVNDNLDDAKKLIQANAAAISTLTNKTQWKLVNTVLGGDKSISLPSDFNEILVEGYLQDGTRHCITVIPKQSLGVSNKYYNMGFYASSSANCAYGFQASLTSILTAWAYSNGSQVDAYFRVYCR